MTDLVREVRLAIRALLRRPGFALAAMVTLGLGLGATGAIYALLDAVVLRPLPYSQSEQLVKLSSRVPVIDPEAKWGLSEAGYHHFREEASTLTEVAAVGSVFSPTNEVTVTGDFQAERVQLAQLSAGAFQVLGLAPIQGRLFVEAEERPGAAPVVLLGWDYWQRRFGGEPVLGRMLEIQAVPQEIIGIMPRGVHLPEAQVDVWAPAGLDPSRPPVNSHWIGAVARLAPGVTVEQAQAEVDRITARFEETFPNAYGGGFVTDTEFRTEVTSLHREVVGGMARTLWVLLGAVGFVLLIAVANVANLFLVRLEARRGEVAMRATLGARRGHLAVHYLAESLLVAAGGAVVALAFAAVAVRTITALAPDGFPRLAEVALTPGSMALTVGAALLAGLVFGLAPLMGRDLEPGLVRETRGATLGKGRRAIRSGLIVSQTAMALLLLAGAGLMLQSYRNLQAVELGFQPADALTFNVALPFARYDSWDAVAAFHRTILTRIEALPGVVAAGAGTLAPMPEVVGCAGLATEDDPPPGEDRMPCVAAYLASPGVFEALGVRLEGEASGWGAVEAGAGGVVVTRALADRFWPGEDPLGKGIRGNGSEPPFYRVTAVTEPVRLTAVDGPPLQAAFFPFLPIAGAQLWSPPFSPTFVVRTGGRPPLDLVPAIRALVAEMDGDVPLADVRTLEDRVSRSASMARTSFTLILLLVAGTVALLLSTVGIYGVISYVVAQRKGEMGIRMALGAPSASVRTMVVRQSLVLVVAGLVVGAVGALAGGRALESLLFEVSPTNLRVVMTMALGLLGVGFAASFIPANRAVGMDPMEVLRAE
ncbi:MAG: ABC transporter permease [Gemmatimonadota bacterium]